MSFCKAIKRNGYPCKQTELERNGYCQYHQDPKYHNTKETRTKCIATKRNGHPCGQFAEPGSKTCEYH